MNLPKVSVCITTYNHEKYIGQALDSVLAQKTDFEFEVIVGEDDSNDRTREVVKDYARRHPNKIQLFLNDRADVIYINGRPTGRWNFINNLKHARGKYISLLEGDDYWIDNGKLQKQVDFLDANPDFSICFSNSKIWNEKESRFELKGFCETHAHTKLKPIIHFKDISMSHWIPTGTVMYQHAHFEKIPAWFYEIPTGDYGIFLSLLDKGKGKFINEYTSVYRVHDGGCYSSLTQEEKMESAITFLKIVRNQFGFKRGKAMNQIYRKLRSQKYRSMDGFTNNALWFYNRAMQEIWQVLFSRDDELH